MYEVTAYKIPEGCNYQDKIKELMENIKAGKDVEESKDILYRMTYLIVVPELDKFSYLGPRDELISYMSIAFMRTINGCDLDKPGASFIGYYKRCVHTVIINEFYGKHKRTPESREEYRYFLNGIRSLSEELYDKNDVETGTLEDLLEDESNATEEEINRIDMKDAIYKAIDEMVTTGSKIKSRGKDIFTYYIECRMVDEGATYEKVVKKFGTCKGNVSNIVNRYRPRLYEILKREGYIHG